MTIIRLAAWLAVSLALPGCGPSQQPNAPTAPPPAKDAVSNDMTRAMDKARSVEATTMEHKEAIDRNLQEAEGH